MKIHSLAWTAVCLVVAACSSGSMASASCEAGSALPVTGARVQIEGSGRYRFAIVGGSAENPRFPSAPAPALATELHGAALRLPAHAARSWLEPPTSLRVFASSSLSETPESRELSSPATTFGIGLIESCVFGLAMVYAPYTPIFGSSLSPRWRAFGRPIDVEAFSALQDAGTSPYVSASPNFAQRV